MNTCFGVNRRGQAYRVLKVIHVCPNCRKRPILRYDDIHDETYCLRCGLVISAPPVCGLVFPGLEEVEIRRYTDINLYFV